MTRAYEVRIRWRSAGGSHFAWTLNAIATNSSALVIGLAEYFGADTSISVKAVKL